MFQTQNFPNHNDELTEIARKVNLPTYGGNCNTLDDYDHGWYMLTSYVAAATVWHRLPREYCPTSPLGKSNIQYTRRGINTCMHSAWWAGAFLKLFSFLAVSFVKDMYFFFFNRFEDLMHQAEALRNFNCFFGRKKIRVFAVWDDYLYLFSLIGWSSKWMRYQMASKTIHFNKLC